MFTPTRIAAQGAIVDEPSEATGDLSTLDVEKIWVEVEGRKQFFNLQKLWSRWIIIWITCLIIFNTILTVLVGLGWLDFKATPWFVTAVTVETFLQVVGLGYVAARFLFSSGVKPTHNPAPHPAAFSTRVSSASLSVSASGVFSSHSQITSARQPRSARAASEAASRATFRAILARQ